VILITCDTLRVDHVGCYGYARPTTPQLDALARESLLFENAWSAAPLTGPSLSSLLSGRMPDETGVTRNNRELMPESVTTLAEVVRDAGYATAAVVSNGMLRRAPAEQGNFGVQQGFASYDDEMPSMEANRPVLERTAGACTDAALRWLDSKEAGGGRFFLWVHYQDPHGPYTPPEEHMAPFRGDHAAEPELALSKDQYGKGGIPRYQFVNGEKRRGDYVDRYDGEIHYFDAELGRLVAGLRAKGWWDDALVVFTADHGEYLGEHGFWFCHGEELWRELLRVPLLVKPPRASKTRGLDPEHKSLRVRELAAHVDVWPTVLAALDVDGPKNRGVSLCDLPLPAGRVVPQFLGPTRAPDRFLGFTDGRWRVVSPDPSTNWLFDLETDPSEQHDVANDHPDVVMSLGKRYVEFMSREKGPVLRAVLRKIDKESLRGMQGLGYTDGGDGAGAAAGTGGGAGASAGKR
jgi:arylsulfatase A-like enzyme